MANNDELNIKDIIDKTKNFDQPYAPQIPVGKHEVEVKSFEVKLSKSGYRMMVITVADVKDREARVNQMLELKWIAGTIRLIKGLYTHNVPDAEKEETKEKINKFFDQAKDEQDLQDKCADILQKLIDNGKATGWLKVYYKNVGDQYPDRQLSAYEPEDFETNADVVIEDGDIDDNGVITTDNVDEMFKEK
jgi:hypothetical protein